MEIITMKLVDLVKPEKNVRIHTEQQLKEFQRSVKMFGQIRPIVVDENNVILAGNGLYETLIAMGKETADVYKYDNLTENQKKKLMIADNKIFSLGIENLDTLNSFLEDLQGDLDIPGFDEDILKQMVSEAEDVTEKLSEYGTLDDEEIQSIKESGERKEQQIQKAEAEQATPAPQPIAQPQQEMPEDSEDTTEVKKSEIYLFLWQSGTRKGQLRVSQFFSIDTAKSLVKMNEYYPDLMERIVRREPNAYLAALYWDSEMFGRSTAARKQNEKGMTEKDYKAALLELFSDMDGNFQTKHKRYVAERYRNFFMSVSAIADNKDCKAIYEGLISGDPKLRSYRALYQRIYGKYITEAKKKEGMTNG